MREDELGPQLLRAFLRLEAQMERLEQRMEWWVTELSRTRTKPFTDAEVQEACRALGIERTLPRDGSRPPSSHRLPD